MKEEREREVESFVRTFLRLLIVSPETETSDRREDRLFLIKLMKRAEIFGIQNKVALTVLDELHRIRVGHHNEDALYNLLAIILGNNGHGMKFSPAVSAEISKMKKKRRWRKLSPNSPSRILLQV
ncbi:MAG TPA: hypothetical protein DEA27_01530 [Candidatus Moranbacteria bacterium]|nr:hypothetical protein [Candidatus Moranbacteria bacterium]